MYPLWPAALKSGMPLAQLEYVAPPVPGATSVPSMVRPGTPLLLANRPVDAPRRIAQSPLALICMLLTMPVVPEVYVPPPGCAPPAMATFVFERPPKIHMPCGVPVVDALPRNATWPRMLTDGCCWSRVVKVTPDPMPGPSGPSVPVRATGRIVTLARLTAVPQHTASAQLKTLCLEIAIVCPLSLISLKISTKKVSKSMAMLTEAGWSCQALFGGNACWNDPNKCRLWGNRGTAG